MKQRFQIYDSHPWEREGQLGDPSNFPSLLHWQIPQDVAKEENQRIPGQYSGLNKGNWGFEDTNQGTVLEKQQQHRKRMTKTCRRSSSKSNYSAHWGEENAVVSGENPWKE